MKRRDRSQSVIIPIKFKRRRRKTPLQASTLKIGEVSKISEIPIVTLRFYENEGLIQSFKADENRKSSHRRFSRSIFLHLDFIRVCRSAGLSIPQIKSILKLYRGYKVPSKVNMAALRRSIDLIRTQKSILTRIEKLLLYRLRHPGADLDELFERKPDIF